MRLRLLALATLAVVGSSANAAVSWTDPNLVRVNLAGATALRATFAGLVINDLCSGATDTTLYNTNGTSSFGVAGNSHWAVTCTLPAAGAAKLGLAAGTPFALVKSDAGGSAQGVFTLGHARPFLNPATCTGSGASFTCSGNTPATVHLGVSDVEPKMFQGVNVPDDSMDPDVPSYSVSGPDLAGMTIAPVVQTVFGVAVNTNLYNAMFAKQGLASKKDASGAACTTASTDENCIPTIGYAEARSFFQGTENNWRMLSNDANLLDSQVNVCRRVPGSGTQAAANTQFMGFPCGSNPMPVARWSDSSSAAPRETSPFLGTMADGTTYAQHLLDNIPTVAVPASGGGLFVYEGSGTGDVTSCLARAQTAGGYAIGHVSKENAANANWKHVKLEGANPLRDNAKAGRYDYLVESTMQYRAAGLSASMLNVVNKLIAEVKKPAALARLSAANQEGVAALPGSYSGAYGTGTADEVKFGSRVTRAGNTCNGLTAVK